MADEILTLDLNTASFEDRINNALRMIDELQRKKASLDADLARGVTPPAGFQDYYANLTRSIENYQAAVKQLESAGAGGSVIQQGASPEEQSRYEATMEKYRNLIGKSDAYIAQIQKESIALQAKSIQDKRPPEVIAAEQARSSEASRMLLRANPELATPAIQPQEQPDKSAVLSAMNAKAAENAIRDVKIANDALGQSQGASQASDGIRKLSADAENLRTIFEATGGDVGKTQEQLSALQWGADRSSAAFSELGINTKSSGKTLEDLQKNVSETKKAFDGSPDSVKKSQAAVAELDAMMKQYNDTTGKTKTFVEQLSETFSRQIMRIGIGVAVWTTLRTAQQEIKETIKAMEDYSLQVGRFAANTQQSIGAAAEQYGKLRDAAEQAGYLPATAAAGIQEAGRFNKSAGGQQDLVTQASKLSEAMGLQDITQATNALGEANLATGQSYEKLANLAYAAYQQVGGDASQFMTIFPQVQALVDATGGSFDELFVTMTRGMAASGRSASEVGQVLNRFTENINGLRGDKILDFAQQLQALSGVNALNPDMSLRSVDEILKAIQQKWASFAPEVQQQILDILAGSKLKSTLRTAGTALGAVYGEGTIEGIDASLNNGLAKIDSTFGAIKKRIEANIKAMESEGNAFGALVQKVTSEGGILLGSATGGAAGGRRAAMASEMTSGGTPDSFNDYRKNIIDQMGKLSPEDAQSLADDYNGALRMALGKVGSEPYLITPAMSSAIIASSTVAGVSSGKAFAGGMFAGLAGLPDIISGIVEKTRPQPSGGAGQGAGRFNMNTPQGSFGAKMAVYGQSITPGSPTYDPNAQNPISSLQQLDMTKYTQDEINAAKQLAVQLAMQEVQLAYELTLATTGDAAVAKRVSEELQNQIDKTVTLVKTSQGLKAEWGAVGKYMQDAMQDIKEQKKSDFHFQRLKDIDPSQAGLIQQLTTMYTQMLQKMGSDEPVVKVNTLMGENNVYKQFTGSMTALQMALEDLTKVEKAQLSGTWNMPAGATALVPISSLDIQRWNKSGSGGGIDPAALAGLMGATNQSGDKVSGAVDNSANRIVSAINSMFPDAKLEPTKSQEQLISELKSKVSDLMTAGKGGQVPGTVAGAIQGEMDKFWAAWRVPFDAYNKAKTQQEPGQQIFKANSDASRPNIGAQNEASGTQLASLTQSLGAISNSISLMTAGIGARGGLGGGGGGASSLAKYGTSEKTPVNVNVSMLPVKANFNANINVLMDGRVVARALQPILYQMLVRSATGLGMSQKGALR